MKDIDNLKTALHTPPPEGFAALDTGAIMSAGKRIRRRRRVQSGAGLVAVAAAVVVVVTGVNSFKTEESPVAVGGPSLTTSAAAPATTWQPAQESRVPLGDVIGTGIFDDLGERVFYLVKVDLPVELPETRFGLMAGHRTADGKLTGELMSNELKGSDRRPGFHVVDGGETIRGQFMPVCGYYVGPAARITSTVHGNPVDAKLAYWSEDPAVVVFWFTEQDVPSSNLLTPPVAVGKNSAKLPS
jgi:hypothetical protein